MQLEFLEEGSADCPLLRLSHFTGSDVQQVLDAIRSLINDTEECIEIHRLPFVESINGCRLTFWRSIHNQYVVRVADMEFRCCLDQDEWSHTAELLAPFVQESKGFRWIVEGTGEAPILISQSGQW